VEKLFRAGETTEGNITRGIHLVRWKTNTIDTHSEYAILIAFNSSNCYTKAPKCEAHFIACLANIK